MAQEKVNSLSLRKTKKNNRLSHNSSLKSQSAMEYLMTYGWAILIIAIVMVAMFSLGIFNPLTFAPRAQPGSCKVFRSVMGVNLEGVCNNEIPEYAAQFNEQSNIIVSEVPSLNSPTKFSISVWVNIPPNADEYIIDKWTYTPGNYRQWSIDTISANSLNFRASTDGTDAGTSWAKSTNLPSGSWILITGVYNSANVMLFVNGDKVATTPLSSVVSTTNSLYIGAGDTGGANPFTGVMSNIQIYNTSLSSNVIQAMYTEGIGGAPIDLQNLAGWWPLNGNANDYSGNGNGGTPTNIIYTSAWTSGYTQP
ncbi:MAG: LamG domain-containing protein [Candidatus Micrarchaeaceae archaeon]